MKHILLTVAAFSFLTGGSAFAGDNHAHKETDKQGAHSHKHEKCDKCKKDEKNCKCEDKEKHDDHEHKEDQKDSK